MNVLVDTSVWVAHIRHTNDALVELIERDWVLGHPMVLAEIACGTPDSTLWTLDTKLMELAKRFDVQFVPSLH